MFQNMSHGARMVINGLKYLFATIAGSGNIKNRHIKVGFTIPIHTLEELDKKTTYQGRNRSRWIVKAIKDRLDNTSTPEEMSERKILAILLATTKDPILRAICQIKLSPQFDKWIITTPEYDELMKNPLSN